MSKIKKAQKKVIKALRKRKIVARRKLVAKWPDLPISNAIWRLTESGAIRREARGQYRAV